MSRGRIRTGKSPSCAISAKNSFGRIYATPTTRADATSELQPGANIGAGVGHHSPIGGYLEAEDLVFILDVNSDYQPWLVASKRLFDAVNTFDGSNKRGLLPIE